MTDILRGSGYCKYFWHTKSAIKTHRGNKR